MTPRRAADLAGCTVVELVAAAATDGRFAILEHRGARGWCPPPHAHSREDESVYVLEGEVTVFEAGRATRGGPGTCVTLRRHVPHTWRVESDLARVLTVISPGALADVMLEAGPRVPADRLPGAPAPGSPSPEAIASLLAQHGVLEVDPERVFAT